MLDPLSISIPLSPPTPAPCTLPVRRLFKPTSTPGDYLMELSYSSLSDFITCHRKGENRLVHNRIGAFPAAAKNFGKAFHGCEEIRLRHGWSEETHQRQLAYIQDFFLRNPVSPDEYRNGDRLVEVMQQYNRRFATPGAPLYDDWPRKILQHQGEPLIERPFKLPLTSIHVGEIVPYLHDKLVVQVDDPLANVATPKPHRETYLGTVHVILTGILDTVISEHGLNFIVDHKTSSRGGAEFLSWYRLSLQTRLYALAMIELLDLPIAGLILNGVVVRALTKTGTGTDFERHTYMYSSDQLDDARRSLIATCEDFLHCLVRGYFPQASLSFKSPCSGCAYHDNCCLPFTQRPADLASAVYTDNTVSGMDEAAGAE